MPGLAQRKQQLRLGERQMNKDAKSRTKLFPFSAETVVYALLFVSAGVLAILLLTQIVHGIPAVVEALVAQWAAEALGEKFSEVFFGPHEGIRSVLVIIEGVWL